MRRAEALRDAWGEVKEHVDQRVRQLEDAVRLAETAAHLKAGGDTPAEVRLEAGSWKGAASRKCEYWRNAPPPLVEIVRSVKGGVKGSAYTFTASRTEPTLFRFRRSAPQ